MGPVCQLHLQQASGVSGPQGVQQAKASVQVATDVHHPQGQQPHHIPGGDDGIAWVVAIEHHHITLRSCLCNEMVMLDYYCVWVVVGEGHKRIGGTKGMKEYMLQGSRLKGCRQWMEVYKRRETEGAVHFCDQTYKLNTYLIILSCLLCCEVFTNE